MPRTTRRRVSRSIRPRTPGISRRKGGGNLSDECYLRFLVYLRSIETNGNMQRFLQNPSRQRIGAFFPNGTSCAAESEENLKMAFRRWIFDKIPNPRGLSELVNRQRKQLADDNFANKKRRASALQNPPPDKNELHPLFTNVPESVPNFFDTLISTGFSTKKEVKENYRGLFDFIYNIGIVNAREPPFKRYDESWANALKQTKIPLRLLLGDPSFFSLLTNEQQGVILAVTKSF